MRQKTGLEDGSKIGSCHFVEVRLAREDSKKIKNVQKQLAIQGRQFGDEALVDANSLDRVEVADVRGLHVHGSDGLGLVVLERVAEAFVELERDDRFGQLVEVPTQDVGGIVDGVATPVEPLSVAIGRVKGNAQFLDALLGATETEDALDVSSYGWS